MLRHGLARVVRGLAVGVLLLAAAATARADDANKTLKIGVVYDLTGPFAGGGSELHYLGAKTMIDWFIAHGGVDGYKIQAVYADAQSKPDVAINEAVRLIEQEKVDMLLGFYSSAECVPAAARIEEFKKFMWITTCIASPVLQDRHLKYVFRPQPYGTAMGPGLDRYGGRLLRRHSSARTRRTCASRSSTRTAPMAPTSPRAMTRARRRLA